MPKKTEKALKIRDDRFAAIYVANGRNATRAYMKIFPNAKEITARTEGCKYLAKPYVQSEVDRLTQEGFKKEHLSAEETLALVARLARSDMGDLYWKPGELDSEGKPTHVGRQKPLHELPESVRRNIKSIEHTENDGVEIVKVTLWDKPGQIRNALQHHRLISDKVEVGVDKEFGDMLKAAIRNLEGGK